MPDLMHFLPLAADTGSWTFEWPEIGWPDIYAIGVLVLLEMLLSGDNALVLAIMVRQLPAHQQRKALLYGVVGAFVLRGVCLALAQFLIKYWFLQTLGAAYLAYLTLGYFLSRGHAEEDETHNPDDYHADGTAKGFDWKFWKVVASVELTDLAFAIDSIIVAVGFSNKLWVVVCGGIIGLLAMRFIADLCVRLLKSYPTLESTAYLLVGWVSIKLFVLSFNGFCVSVLAAPEGQPAQHLVDYPWIPEKAFQPHAHLMPEGLFWGVTFSILLLGVINAVARGKAEHPAPDEPKHGDEPKPADPAAVADAAEHPKS